LAQRSFLTERGKAGTAAMKELHDVAASALGCCSRPQGWEIAGRDAHEQVEENADWFRGSGESFGSGGRDQFWAAGAANPSPVLVINTGAAQAVPVVSQGTMNVLVSNPATNPVRVAGNVTTTPASKFQQVSLSAGAGSSAPQTFQPINASMITVSASTANNLIVLFVQGGVVFTLPGPAAPSLPGPSLYTLPLTQPVPIDTVSISCNVSGNGCSAQVNLIGS
jgi:hypothetical protein